MAETAIPSKYIEFCKAVCKLATQHDLRRLGMTLSPQFDGEWTNDITVQWVDGRHGDSAHCLHITSTVTVHTVIDPTKATPGYECPWS